MYAVTSLHNVVLCVACDDARIRVWRIPEDGKGGTQEEADFGTIITPHATLTCMYTSYSSTV